MITLPIKSHGGKHYMMGLLRRLTPVDMVRAWDLFGGSGQFILGHKGSARVYNDLDIMRTNVMYCVRRWPEIVAKAASGLGAPSEEHFEILKARLAVNPSCVSGASLWDGNTHNQCVVAAQYMAINRWSRSGLGNSFSVTRRTRRGMNELLSSWGSAIASLGAVSQLIPDDIQCDDAFDTLPRLKRSDFAYLDPPYHPDTRKVKDAYVHDMTAEQHDTLIGLCCASPAKLMISGYRCPAYDTALKDWHRHDREIVNHSGQNDMKETRVESVWVNYSECRG